MKIWFNVMIFFGTILLGCLNINSEIRVKANSFKIQVPVNITTKGIFIDTYWGAYKTKNRLLWDNNSPTWANKNIISENKSISKFKRHFFSTETAEGRHLQGNIYKCDSLSIDSLTFVNVPFYDISNQINGVFGDNLISKGVWEIDFRNKKMIFASSVDSLNDKEKANIFISTFSNNGIGISIIFRKGIKEDVQIDFGFNGGILLPTNTFNKITSELNDKNISNLRFSTPSGGQVLETIQVIDTFQIQKEIFRTIISTNKLTKEKLIGLGFFEQFEFVIFDYNNKLFYVSKKRN